VYPLHLLATLKPYFTIQQHGDQANVGACEIRSLLNKSHSHDNSIREITERLSKLLHTKQNNVSAA